MKGALDIAYLAMTLLVFAALWAVAIVSVAIGDNARALSATAVSFLSLYAARTYERG